MWLSFDYSHSKVYLQRVDRYGYVLWDPPILIGELGNFQAGYARVVDDGTGGALVGYDELIPVDTSGIYVIWEGKVKVQRVDSLGNTLWEEGGVRVSLDSTDQREFEIVSDGEGGAIVGWIDLLGVESYDPPNTVFLQRLSSTGERMWGENGIVISDSADIYMNMVTDTENGAIVRWTKMWDDFSDTLNWFFRIDGDGNIMWETFIPGVEFTFHAWRFTMISDDMGGVIMAGIVEWPTDAIIAHRLSFEGEWMWGEEDVIISDSLLVNNPTAYICVNLDNSSSFTWWNYEGDSSNVYTQTVYPDGNLKYPDGGIHVSDYPSAKSGFGIVRSDSDKIYFWYDARDPEGLYAQKLSQNDVPIWDSGDILVSTRDYLNSRNLVCDKHGGAIVIWSDEPVNGIFAQQISKNGNLGEVLLSTVGENDRSIPAGFYLDQNYPNPFNPITTIRYDLPEDSHVFIKIYDILGREVRILINFEQTAGYKSVQWDGKDVFGNTSGSGLYIYKISAGDFNSCKKMLLLR